MFAFIFFPIHIVAYHNHGMFFDSEKTFKYFCNSLCYSIVDRMWHIILWFNIKCIYIIENRMIIGKVNKISMINDTMLCNK